MTDYDRTPSFYRTEEMFRKFLGQSSYYMALQNGVSKIVKLCRPETLVDLGAGTGATANRLARENPGCRVTGIDMRDEMIALARSTAPANAAFLKDDMVGYVGNLEQLPDMTIFLYSFHHVTDPLETKADFLRVLRGKLPSKGKVCVADIFLPESFGRVELLALTRNRWSLRELEGYSSTFWAALGGLGKEEIERSREAGIFCAENESRAGDLIMKRDNEYPVSMAWLAKTAEDAGFSVDLAEPCNCIGDGIVLLSAPQ